YGVLACLVVGNVSGAIVGSDPLGELNVQSGYYAMASWWRLCHHGDLLCEEGHPSPPEMDAKDGSVFLSHYLGPLDHVIGGQHNHDNWHLLLCLEVRRSTEFVGQIGDCAELIPQCVATGDDFARAWVAVHSSTDDGLLHYASALRAVHGMLLDCLSLQ
ncbi:hypothetical protein B0H13DRAFT_1891018, partial [Mycena leptocephala]